MNNPAILLTLSRLLFAPLFAAFFIEGFVVHQSIAGLCGAIAVAILIELSDAFDGHIARARGQVSNFGKVVDPMADSVARQTMFLSFMIAGIIPWWMFLIFLNRDAILSVFRILSAADGSVVAAKKSGKIKAIIQAIGVFFVLAVCVAQALQIGWMPKSIAGFHPGFWIMVIPALVTVLSMFDYLVPNWHVITKAMRPIKEMV